MYIYCQCLSDFFSANDVFAVIVFVVTFCDIASRIYIWTYLPIVVGLTQ